MTFNLATLEGINFKEHDFKLNPGDSLFVYTDGVPEAIKAKNELMEPDRMVAALNKDPDAAPKQILTNVKEGINSFVKGAEQFDDITMMCMKYKGAQKGSDAE